MKFFSKLINYSNRHVLKWPRYYNILPPKHSFIHSFIHFPTSGSRGKGETIIFTIISSKSKNIVKYNSEYFKNISFVEILKFSKLINYLTDMC